MSKRKPFIIQPGVGGLEGRARLFDEQARGAHNERIYKWLRERITSEGVGNAPQVTEIIVPDADLIFTANALQDQNGYNDNDLLPKAGPSNTWIPSGELSAGFSVLAYRNLGGGTGRFNESLDTGIDLPVLDKSYVRFDQISGNADGFDDNIGTNSLGSLVNRDGVTSQSWCWFIVMRAWDRGPAAASATAFGMPIGGRKLTAPMRGYAFFTRSAGSTSTWSVNLFWIEGSTAFTALGTQAIPFGNTSDDWVVFAVQSEPGRFVYGASRDYADCDVKARTADIHYKSLADGPPYFQFGLDGSSNGGGDNDLAELRWFNRALSPSEFNIVMADLLVEYGLSVL